MRVSELQSALFSWYDFNETQKELAYLLKQERHQLECLCIATDLVTFSEKDLHDTIGDLKVRTWYLIDLEFFNIRNFAH